MFEKLFGKSEPVVKERVQGKIVKVSEKGYGFIISPDIRYARVFFHWSAVRPEFNFVDLKIGDRVEFEPEFQEGKGYRARKITVLNGEK